MPGRLLPEPARRRLKCCRPWRPLYPGGPAWTHSRYCRVARGRKLDRLELFELGINREPPRALTPGECNRVEPVGETALRAWLAHRPGCECFACSYIEAHADDETEDASL